MKPPSLTRCSEEKVNSLGECYDESYGNMTGRCRKIDGRVPQRWTSLWRRGEVLVCRWSPVITDSFMIPDFYVVVEKREKFIEDGIS